MSEEKEKGIFDKLNQPSPVQPDRAEGERAVGDAMAQAQRMAAPLRPAEAAPQEGVVQVRSLHIRKDHTVESSGVGGLVAGNEVTIYETWTDGKDTWARIGPDQWAAMVYQGETYIKLK